MTTRRMPSDAKVNLWQAELDTLEYNPTHKMDRKRRAESFSARFFLGRQAERSPPPMPEKDG